MAEAPPILNNSIAAAYPKNVSFPIVIMNVCDKIQKGVVSNVTGKRNPEKKGERVWAFMDNKMSDCINKINK